jgi:hypothetical protein
MTESTLAATPDAAPPQAGSCLVASVCSALATLGLNALIIYLTATSTDGWGTLFMMFCIIPVNLVHLGVLLLFALLVKRSMKGGSIAPYVLTSVLLPLVAIGADYSILSTMHLKTSGC